MRTLTTDAMRWTVDDLGEWLMIRSPRARSVLNGLDLSKSYDVEIKQHRERRSLSANAYFWQLVHKIAGEVGEDVTELYRRYIKGIGGNAEVLRVKTPAVKKMCEAWESKGLGWVTETFPSSFDGFSSVIFYYGSSFYDTRQMSVLIDRAVQDAKSLGIETMTPQEIEGMMQAWQG